MLMLGVPIFERVFPGIALRQFSCLYCPGSCLQELPATFAHLSIPAWVHSDDMGELPHAASCVFILHKDNIVDGQVPARSQPLLAFLQGKEELFPSTRPEFVSQVLYTSPALACVYFGWLEGSRGSPLNHRTPTPPSPKKKHTSLTWVLLASRPAFVYCTITR